MSPVISIQICNINPTIGGYMTFKYSASIFTFVTTAFFTLASSPVYATTGPDLLQAVTRSDYIQVTQLLDAGADINYCTKQGNTALILAAKIGDKPTIEALLKGNPDVNFQNKAGATALMIAAKYGHGHVIEMLLNHNADPTIKNNMGVSATRFAKAYDHQEVFERLIEAEKSFSS